MKSVWWPCIQSVINMDFSNECLVVILRVRIHICLMWTHLYHEVTDVLKGEGKCASMTGHEGPEGE